MSYDLKKITSQEPSQLKNVENENKKSRSDLLCYAEEAMEYYTNEENTFSEEFEST